MNFKTTLVMVVLLAGIAGAYLWLRSAGPGDVVPPPNAPEAFVTGREFERIVIGPYDSPITLENQDGRWWQTQPVRFPVTGEAVETLINAALSLTPREVFTFPQDDPVAVERDDALASFGLDPPQAQIAFESDTGVHRLRLGHINVAGTAYLQVTDDEQVYLVDAALHHAVLDADPKTWRPTKLPTLDASRVNRIGLNTANGELQLTRTPEGWSLRPEGGERADDDAARQLAAVAQQLQPQRYLSDDPTSLNQYGLASPLLTLTTGDATGARQILRVGQPADLGGASVYATWSDTDDASPVVFTLPAASLNQLESLTADMLRDPRLVTALPGTIRGQRVNRVGRDTLEIVQRPDGQGLALVEPQTGYDPDPQRGSDWLTTLTRAVPVGHARAPREAQAPVALIELQLTGGRTEHVRLYADRDGRDDIVLAVRENEHVAALVPHDQLAPLLAPVVTLRDRRLPDVGPIRELRLTRDDGQVFAFNLQDDATWQPQNADFTGDWEAERFEELGQWVESPAVEAWTPMSELPRGPMARLSLGPERPAYVVNVDQNLGQRTDLPGVFRLPPTIATLFTAEYRRRLLLPYRPEQITQVTFGVEAAPASSDSPPDATVQRDAQNVFVDSEGSRLENQSIYATMFNTLAGLKAKRIVPKLSPEQRQPPIRFWELQTDDGQTHRLRRFNQGVWSLDDEKYFYIDADADQQLTALLSP